MRNFHVKALSQNCKNLVLALRSAKRYVCLQFYACHVGEKYTFIVLVRFNDANPVATGGFGGLSPPNKVSRPPKLKYEKL